MMTQALLDAGFNVGTNLIPGSTANPNGFFEDIEVNRINDAILADVAPAAGALRPPRSLSWLGAFTAATAESPLPAGLVERIPPPPFVLKDPRFSYTYPAWRPLIGEHRVVVMVRPIAEVHESLAAMVDREPDQFSGVRVTKEVVSQMWTATYDAIETWADERVMYVADSSLRDRSVLASLSAFVGRRVDAPNVEPGLRRSAPAEPSQSERAVFDRCAVPVQFTDSQ